MFGNLRRGLLPACLLIFSALISGQDAFAAPVPAVWAAAQAHQGPLLATLKDLVAIESGSGDREGLDRISQLI